MLESKFKLIKWPFFVILLVCFLIIALVSWYTIIPFVWDLFIEKKYDLIPQIIISFILVIISILFLLCLWYPIQFLIDSIFGFFALLFSKKNSNLNNPKNKKFPYLAVGIFTFNDFDIEWATEIIKLKYDYKQIFVVDDSTKDEYIKIVDEFCKKNQLQIIRGRNFFQKKFNYSLAAAKNNFILSLDKKFEYFIECGVGDYLPSDYVNVLMNRVINEPGIGLINGLCFGKFNNSMFHNIEAVQYCSLTYRNYFTNLYRDTWIAGGCAIYNINATKNSGLWNDMCVDDVSCSLNMIKNGYHVVTSKDTYFCEFRHNNFNIFRKWYSRIYSGSLDAIRHKQYQIYKTKQSFTSKWSTYFEAKFFKYLLPFLLLNFILPITLYLLNINLNDYNRFFLLLLPLTLNLSGQIISMICSWLFFNQRKSGYFIVGILMFVIYFSALFFTLFLAYIKFIFHIKPKFTVTNQKQKKKNWYSKLPLLFFLLVLMGSHVAIIYYLPVKSALAINILDLFDFAYYHITFVMFYGVYLCMILAHLFDQAKTKIKKYTLTEKIITQSYSFKE